MEVQSSNPFDNCGYYIVAKNASTESEYMDKIRKITRDFLVEKHIYWTLGKNNLNEWSIAVDELSDAVAAAGHLMQHHTYLHARQKKVELFIVPGGAEKKIWHHAIRIGDRPPTSNDLKTNEEVYFQQYLPDHSLFRTRLIHTAATVAGVSTALYGIFSGNWLLIPAGIFGIYEAGFHSHLFVEKNIPSSAKYPLQSVYSDLRVTCQMLLNPVTGGMDEDLERAGIYKV